jgi:hypothetical protein
VILELILNHPLVVEFIDIDGHLEEELEEFESSFERDEVVDL